MKRIAFAIATLVAVRTAHAQSVYTPRFDPDPFVVTSDPSSVGLVDSGTPMAWAEWSAGLVLRAGGPPLRICVRDAAGACPNLGDVVSSRFAADVVGAIGLGRVGFHVQLPTILHQGTDFEPATGMQSLASAAIGDLRLGAKLLVVGGSHGHLGIDVVGSLPTGGGANLVGDDGTIVTPRLVVDVRAGRLSLAANVGYAWRQRSARLANLYVDDELVWAGAAELALGSSLDVGASVYGRVGVKTDPLTGEMPSSVARPAEALGTLRYWMTRTLALEAAGGAGLGDGYGAPSFRVLAGVRIVHRKDPTVAIADRDHDGIADRVDRCPTDPEDHDGFQDDDGCPELDNDGDGNLDGTDKCPNEPEDTDGFEDADGCPDPDNDHDGIADGPDLCPLAPEDKDGFQDDDGCPDPDNDGDGLLDAADKCPNEAETKNGYQDEDGCADAIPVQVRKYTGVIDGIRFESLSADIVPSSYKVLDKAISVLVDYPGINVEIQGHTDDVPIGVRSTFADNLALSQARADAVMRYLVKQGILEGRLTSKGYGDSRPIVAPGKLRGDARRAARAKNRRVEFAITPGATASQAP